MPPKPIMVIPSMKKTSLKSLETTEKAKAQPTGETAEKSVKGAEPTKKKVIKVVKRVVKNKVPKQVLEASGIRSKEGLAKEKLPMTVSVPMEVTIGPDKDGFDLILDSGSSGAAFDGGMELRVSEQRPKRDAGEDGMEILDQRLMVQNQTGKEKGYALVASDERVSTELSKIEKNISGDTLESLLIKLSEEQSSAGISSGSTILDPLGDGTMHNLINYLCKSKEIVEEEISLLKQEKLQLQSKLESAWRMTNRVQSLLHEQRKISRTSLLDEKIKSLQFQKKIETLTKEKEELSKENEALSRQLEDARQSKFPTGDGTNMTAINKKVKVMETCIEILENSKEGRELAEREDGPPKRNLCEQKKLVEEFERDKHVADNVAKSASASMARFPSESVLDDQTAANTSLSNGVGVPTHPAETSPLVDTFTPASGYEFAAGAPRKQPLMVAAESSSRFQQTMTKNRISNVLKSNVEIHSAGSKLRQPHLQQPNEPTGDIVMSNTQQSFDSLEKVGESYGTKTRCDLASPTLSSACKHLPSSSATELHEELLIEQKTGSIALVPFLKKSKVSDSPQESVEGQALFLPTYNLGKVPYFEVLSDASGDLHHVSNKASEVKMDEGEEPREPPLDGRSQSISQKELCAASEDGLDQRRGIDEVFNNGLRDGKLQYLQKCTVQVRCDKGKGDLVPDVKEKQECCNMSAMMSAQETVEGHCEPMTISVAHSALAASTADKAEAKLPEPLSEKKSNFVLNNEIIGSVKSNTSHNLVCMETEDSLKAGYGPFGPSAKRSKTELCKFFNSASGCIRGANCNYVHSKDQTKTVPLWLATFKNWLPGFLQEKWCSGEEQLYPLSSLKADFRDKCGLELDHESHGYPKLSGFMLLFHDICHTEVRWIKGQRIKGHLALVPPNPLPRAFITSKEPRLSPSDLQLLCEDDNYDDNDIGKNAEGKTMWNLKGTERSDFSLMMSSQEKEEVHAEAATISVSPSAIDKVKTATPVLLNEKTNGYGANKEISIGSGKSNNGCNQRILATEQSAKATSNTFPSGAKGSKTAFCKFFHSQGSCNQGANCCYVHSMDHAKNLQTWVTTFSTWLPGFLQKKWACRREEQWYLLDMCVHQTLFNQCN